MLFANGQEVVDYFDSLLEDIKQNDSQVSRMTPQQPVALLLLDINMPIMSGMEALKAIKEKFR